MRLPDDVEELHLIAEHHTACRALRGMGWGGIVFGLINIGLGIAFVITLHPINAILALIGLFLLASGVWCLVLPGAETWDAKMPTMSPRAMMTGQTAWAAPTAVG